MVETVMRKTSSKTASRLHTSLASLVLGALIVMGAGPAFAQATGSKPAPTAPKVVPDRGVDVPAEYVIGPEDVLTINFWRDADMSGDVTVRPDGKITLPLIGELDALGLTPDVLKGRIEQAASKFQNDVSIAVVVRQINSRKVFITGQVASPGAYPLTAPRTVMQLIALAGGLTEFADKKKISIMRTEGGKTTSFKLNYNEVAQGKNLAQNILLKPGDTVVVP